MKLRGLNINIGLTGKVAKLHKERCKPRTHVRGYLLEAFSECPYTLTAADVGRGKSRLTQTAHGSNPKYLWNLRAECDHAFGARVSAA
jgi:hypothetical protein